MYLPPSLPQENVDQMPTGLMLIGNKQDLDEMNEREVSTETGETFAKVYPSPTYIGLL